MAQSLSSTQGNTAYHIPAAKTDFISSKVDVLVLEDLEDLSVQSLQESPCGVQGGVNGSKGPAQQQSNTHGKLQWNLPSEKGTTSL